MRRSGSSIEPCSDDRPRSFVTAGTRLAAAGFRVTRFGASRANGGSEACGSRHHGCGRAHNGRESWPWARDGPSVCCRRRQAGPVCANQGSARGCPGRTDRSRCGLRRDHGGRVASRICCKRSGESSFLVTDDQAFAAAAILYLGSYMLYGQHAARPPLEAFESLRERIPNFSLQMSDLAAAVVRPQLALVVERARQWNERYGLARRRTVRNPWDPAAATRSGRGLHRQLASVLRRRPGRRPNGAVRSDVRRARPPRRSVRCARTDRVHEHPRALGVPGGRPAADAGNSGEAVRPAGLARPDPRRLHDDRLERPSRPRDGRAPIATQAGVTR